jgi:hypothetical protein
MKTKAEVFQELIRIVLGQDVELREENQDVERSDENQKRVQFQRHDCKGGRELRQ